MACGDIKFHLFSVDFKPLHSGVKEFLSRGLNPSFPLLFVHGFNFFPLDRADRFAEKDKGALDDHLLDDLEGFLLGEDFFEVLIKENGGANLFSTE